MATGWDDDFDAPTAGPSFVDRARSAPEDDDFLIADDFGRRSRPAILAQDLAEETPFQQLIRHWMNERHAPDILPGQEMLLGRLLDHIRKQVSPGLQTGEIIAREGVHVRGETRPGADGI